MDRTIKRKRWTLKRLGLMALAAACGVVLIMALTDGLGSRRLRVDGERIQVAEVVSGPFEEYVPVSGEVVPIRTVYLDAVEGGRVDALYVEEGAIVEAGQRLLALSNTNLLLDIMYREAELYQQSNNLRNTRLALEQYRLQMERQLLEIDFEIRAKERTFEAQQGLAEAGLSARNELEEARDDLEYAIRLRELTRQAQAQESTYRKQQIEQLQASLRRIEANLELARRNLEGLVIQAPVSGQLTSLEAEVGETKSRGQRLGKIDVLDGFKVRALVDQHYISRLARGQRATLSHDDEVFGLAVNRISAEVLDGRCEVDLMFAGSEPAGIRRGQTLHVRLRFGDVSEAVLLARGGFAQQTGGRWVFLVDPSGERAVRREVRLGPSNPRHFQVLEGLAPGDQVVVSSYERYDEIDELVIE